MVTGKPTVDGVLPELVALGGTGRPVGYAWRSPSVAHEHLRVRHRLFFLASFVNVALFDLAFLGWQNLQDLGLGVLLVVTLFVRSRRAWGWLTVLCAVWSIMAIVILSPAAYR